MRFSFVRNKKSFIFEMLHTPNLLSSSSVFRHPPMLNFLEGKQMNEQPEVASTTTTTTTVAMTILTVKYIPKKKRMRVLKKDRRK